MKEEAGWISDNLQHRWVREAIWVVGVEMEVPN